MPAEASFYPNVSVKLFALVSLRKRFFIGLQSLEVTKNLNSLRKFRFDHQAVKIFSFIKEKMTHF